jgi:indole-3-glycerol phosphate synthase
MTSLTRSTFSAFSGAILEQNAHGVLAVIPDIKRRSPKEGDLLRGRDPVRTAAELVSYGAAVLSVVTENEHFGGSENLLREIVKTAGAPVLRKDFIRTPEEIEKTADMGASSVLLICSMLSQGELEILFHKALAVGIEPLVETRATAELALAKSIGAKLIGINNRDIATLELDDGSVSRTRGMIGQAPGDAVIISESGIKSGADAQIAAASGANAVLVGTALWASRDMGAMFRELCVSYTGRLWREKE